MTLRKAERAGIANYQTIDNIERARQRASRPDRKPGPRLGVSASWMAFGTKGKHMKAYKITLFFIDFDEVGPQEAKYLIENARLPAALTPVQSAGIEEADIGEWRDDHPLNKLATMATAFEKLFPAVKS